MILLVLFELVEFVWWFGGCCYGFWFVFVYFLLVCGGGGLGTVMLSCGLGFVV